LNYAYHIKLSKEIKLGLGFQPGYLQYRVKLYDARLADAGDDVLTGNILSANALDLNSGFHLYSPKFFVMGAMQQILGKEIQFTTYNNNLAKHFTLLGGYNIKLDSAKMLLQPTLLVRYVKPAPAQIGIMLKATYDKKYWAGISYRTSDAMSVCIGYNLKERLSVGYGYDYSVSGIRKFNSGSHEIVISFITTPKKPSLDEMDEKLNNRIMDQNKLDVKEKY
jgi:type IX secretion system PorP/SprF family membrane protein